MANITPQGFIERNEELKAIADNNYFLDDNNVNVQYINNHLLRHQASFVQEALKQGSGLGTSVTKAYSKYVGQPVGDIQYPMTQLTSDYISQGSGVVTLEKTKEGNNEVWKPTYIPNEKYLLVDGVHTVYRFYVKEKLNAGPIGGGLKEKYLLVQTFLAGENTNTLYLINDI